jgi:hypothetical protein
MWSLITLALADTRPSCVFKVGDASYDLSPLRGVVLVGQDPAFPSRQYNVSVCDDLPHPCIDELMPKTSYNGSVFQMVVDPTSGQAAFCWDAIATTIPVLLPPAAGRGDGRGIAHGDRTAVGAGAYSGNGSESFSLRFNHTGDSHTDCTPDPTMRVLLKVHCFQPSADVIGDATEDTPAEPYTLTGTLTGRCEYELQLGTPLACQ